VGWAVWRSREDRPDGLCFHDNYLGNDQITFSLNFPKGAAQIIGQYCNLIRLGGDGYRAIMANLCDPAGELVGRSDDSEAFTRVSIPDARPRTRVC
jgi:glutamate decarboxylase